METQLIILEQGNIIVSDEEIKAGEWWYCPITKKPDNAHSDKNTLKGLPHKTSIRIIASDNPKHNLPNINYNGLEKEFGIEKFICKGCNMGYAGHWCSWHLNDGKCTGLKKTQELNDKKFSSEDIRTSLIRLIQETSCEDGILIGKTPAEAYKWIENHIKQLQQHKVFNIEIEMKLCNQPYGRGTFSEPEITSNSITITKIL